MRKHAHLFFALLLIALATGAVFFARRFEHARFRDPASIEILKKVMPAFRPADVRSIEFQFRAITLELNLKNGYWAVVREDRPPAPAAAGKIATLLNRLSELAPIRELPAASEKDLGELALADYKPGGSASGCRTIIRGENGKILQDLMFGAAHYRGPEQFGNYSMRQPDGRYLRVNTPEHPEKYRVFLIPGVFEQCVPHAGTWLEHLRFATFEEPLLLRWTEHGKTIWEIRRGRNTYRLNIPDNLRLSNTKTERKIKLLTGAFTRDSAPKDVPFRPGAELRAECGNGFTYILETQDSPREMERFARLKIEFDKKKVLPRAGENTSSLAQRKDLLAKRAAAEQTFWGGRIYVLQPNTISIIAEIPGE